MLRPFLLNSDLAAQLAREQPEPIPEVARGLWRLPSRVGATRWSRRDIHTRRRDGLTREGSGEAGGNYDASCEPNRPRILGGSRASLTYCVCVTCVVWYNATGEHTGWSGWPGNSGPSPCVRIDSAGVGCSGGGERSSYI